MTFFFFYKKISHAQKAHKITKGTKKYKAETSDFHLDVHKKHKKVQNVKQATFTYMFFMHLKMLSFCFYMHKKAQKSTKRKQATFT